MKRDLALWLVIIGLGVLVIYKGNSHGDKPITVRDELADLRREMRKARARDSVALVRENALRDSLAGELAQTEARIHALENALSTLKKKNDELEKKYRALTVVMPDF